MYICICIRKFWKHAKAITGWFLEQKIEMRSVNCFFFFFGFGKHYVFKNFSNDFKKQTRENYMNATFPKMQTHLSIQSLIPCCSLNTPVSWADRANWIFKTYLQTLVWLESTCPLSPSNLLRPFGAGQLVQAPHWSQLQ